MMMDPEERKIAQEQIDSLRIAMAEDRVQQIAWTESDKWLHYAIWVKKP